MRWAGSTAAATARMIVPRRRSGRRHRRRRGRDGRLAGGPGHAGDPGIGPVVAAGWLAHRGRRGRRRRDRRHHRCAQPSRHRRRGRACLRGRRTTRRHALTARVPEAERARAEAILERNAVKISDRGAVYRKSGWKGYDPSAPAYTADQVRRERDLYRHTAA